MCTYECESVWVCVTVYERVRVSETVTERVIEGHVVSLDCYHKSAALGTIDRFGRATETKFPSHPTSFHLPYKYTEFGSRSPSSLSSRQKFLLYSRRIDPVGRSSVGSNSGIRS